VTASTEANGKEIRLGAEHVAGCVALSKSANWNQNEADWRLMLELGHGLGLSLADGTLIASTLVIPYGDFAWISMVLVHPAHRRQGHASRLLRGAISDLRTMGLTPILDATPAGREVYRQEGFRDTWTFKRFHLSRPLRASGNAQAITDWSRLLLLDAEAFGADRSALLRGLQRREPQAARAIGPMDHARERPLKGEAVRLQPLLHLRRVVDHIDIERRRHDGERRLEERHRRRLVARDERADLPGLAAFAAEHEAVRIDRARGLRLATLQPA